MLNDPRDPGAYRLAIAALGLAVAVALAGICWIAAVHVARDTVHVRKTTFHTEKKDPVREEKVTVSVEKDPHRLGMGRVPVELWFVLSVLGGVFVGALIPFSWYARPLRPGFTRCQVFRGLRTRASDDEHASSGIGQPAGAAKPDRFSKPDGHRWAWGSILGGMILVSACAIATDLGHSEYHHNHGHMALYVLGATIAGVLLGLPIPSPGRRDP